MGAGNQTCVLQKSNGCSQLLNHLSDLSKPIFSGPSNCSLDMSIASLKEHAVCSSFLPVLARMKTLYIYIFFCLFTLLGGDKFLEVCQKQEGKNKGRKGGRDGEREEWKEEKREEGRQAGHVLLILCYMPLI